MFDKKFNFFLNTPLLGDDTLIVESFGGTEEISHLYSFVVEVKSHRTSLSLDALVGKHVTLGITLGDYRKRYISGYVRRFVQPSSREDLNHYRVEIVPWLWFLTQRSDCRIFQEKTALEIIKEVFDAAGFSGHYEMKTTATYRKREYCVQYRETDFNFVSRLMEEEGIFYYFTHTSDSHMLVLGDNPGAYKPLQPTGDVIYYRSSEEEQRRPAVMDFAAEHSVRSTKVSLRDFDFVKPSSDLTVMQNASDQYELYDYPGNYTERPDGEHYAKMRLEHAQSLVKQFSGTATDRRLTTGATFDLTEHPRAEYNAAYLLTAVHHSGSQSEESETYQCSFGCIPSDVPFRPQCNAVKPTIFGCQTAVVTGPAGEEIWLDKYGRIKVQFHWDRVGKKDENSSCWIRVARNWAGKNWGIAFHPRIGQEVIVQFIEGDVDKPIVTGSVYNEEQMPPYELPSNSTQSTIKSRSSKDGTPDNFNEIRFEDKKGAEHFLIHAEKDHMVEVENDETHSVGHDETHSVGNDETHTVKNNRTTTIDKDDTLTVKQNRTVTVDGTHTETIKQDTTIKIAQGNYDHKVETGTATYLVESDVTETYNARQSTTVAGDITVKSINSFIHLTASTDIILEVGNSKLEMYQDGTIKLIGTAVLVQANDALRMVGSNTAKISGDVVMSEAANENTITGSNIMSSASINNVVKGDVAVLLNP